MNAVASTLTLLAVIMLGLAAGAMLAEGGVLVPYWRSLPAQSFLDWYAANAQLLLDFFAPLEVGSAVLTVAAAVLGAYRRHAGTALLTASAVGACVVLVTFPLYFQDVNASFANGTIALDGVAAELARWAWWHWLRTAMGIGAFAAALLAVRPSTGVTNPG